MIVFTCTLMLAGGLLVLSGRGRGRTAARRPARAVPNPAPAVASALAAAGLALVVTTIPAVALLAAGVGATVPRMLHRRRLRAGLRDRAAAWPGLLDDITSAVRAGLDLPEALSHAGVRAPGELRAAFAHFDEQYRRSGDFVSAANALQARADDPVCTQLMRSLVIARRVGGHDLTQVLRSLGMFVRADLQVRGELLARQSWTVNAARMAVAAPWVVLVLLSSRPATIAAYRTGTGAAVLLGVAGLSVVAYASMLRIARLDGGDA